MIFLLRIVQKHWIGILLLTLLGGAFALVMSVTQQPLYESTTRLLVLQRHSGDLDAFTAARAAEKLGENLRHVMRTSSFFEKVLAARGVGRDDFPRDEAMRRTAWQKIVVADLIPETSILRVRVRHSDRSQAERLITAVNAVLVSQSEEYLGIPARDLFIRVVDAPLTSVRPVVPDVTKNIALGVGLGLLLSFGYVLVRELIAQRKLSRLPMFKPPQDDGGVSQPIPLVQRLTELTVQADTVYVSRKQREPQLPAVPKLKELGVRAAPSVATLYPETMRDAESVVTERKPDRVDDKEGVVHTMFDDVKAPFGGQYYFQNRLIEVGNGEEEI